MHTIRLMRTTEILARGAYTRGNRWSATNRPSDRGADDLECLEEPLYVTRMPEILNYISVHMQTGITRKQIMETFDISVKYGTDLNLRLRDFEKGGIITSKMQNKDGQHGRQKIYFPAPKQVEVSSDDESDAA